MKYENISTNQANINISSAMSRMNDLCKNLHTNLWEFYNFLTSGYPGIEINNPSFYHKMMEDMRDDDSCVFSKFGYYDSEFSFYLDYKPKENTRRWNIRDKAKHGSKGKKINDINGEHWTRVYMTNPKKEKAIKDQIQQDIQNMINSQKWEVFISDLVLLFYEQVKSPATKTYEQVLSEVYDMFGFVDLNNHIMEIIEKEVLVYYKEDVEKVSICLNKLHDAIDELKAAERRINYYVSLLSEYGIDMEV